MKNFTKIEQLLTTSNLSPEQIDELKVLFQRSDDEELLPVVEILSEDISMAERIYRNYAAKRNAIENNDNIELENIFKDEVDILEKL